MTLKSIASALLVSCLFTASSINAQGDYCRKQSPDTSKVFSFGINADFNLSLAGSQWCPGLGIGLTGILRDKNHHEQFRIDLLYAEYTSVNFSEAQFSNYYSFESADLRLLFNLKPCDRVAKKWIGFDFGYLFSQQGGPINNVFKGGISYYTHNFHLSMDAVNVPTISKNIGGTYLFTLSIPVVNLWLR